MPRFMKASFLNQCIVYSLAYSYLCRKQAQMKEGNNIILYQDDNEITRVSVRFADEDVWLTQNQLAEIYDTTKQNISQHIENILNDGELDANRTVKDFLTVRQEASVMLCDSVRDNYLYMSPFLRIFAVNLHL